MEATIRRGMMAVAGRGLNDDGNAGQNPPEDAGIAVIAEADRQ